MDIRLKIIEVIKKNRISTTEVADALGKKGSLIGLTPFGNSNLIVGNIRVSTPARDSNFEIHQDVEKLQPGEILYVNPIEFTNVAVFGELVAKYAVLYKGAAGIIANGNIRDTARIVRENFPIWAQGSNPVGATNSDCGKEEKFSNSIKTEFENGIAVCDQGGVVLIPKKDVTLKTLQELNRIEALEDLWHFCLDSLKWSTLDIVVNKRYLYDNEKIPKFLLESVLRDGELHEF